MKQPTLLLTAALLATASVSQAQNAGTVLFGENFKAAPEEQRVVHPVSSPYFHEDSFITSDVRAWYATHTLPHNIALNGGHGTVAAVQLRFALTDSLQLVAYKDGYMDLNSGLTKRKGLNDIAAGLKWQFYKDAAAQLWAAGVGYELPLGNAKVFQDDSEARAWVSVNKNFGALHLGATLNYFVSTFEKNSDVFGDSDRLSWHLHADYFVNTWVSPVVELNGVHITKGGRNPLGFSGADLFNFGGDSGEDNVTGAIGAEVRPGVENLSFRAAYETALVNSVDLWGKRITLSAVYTF